MFGWYSEKVAKETGKIYVYIDKYDTISFVLIKRLITINSIKITNDKVIIIIVKVSIYNIVRFIIKKLIIKR